MPDLTCPCCGSAVPEGQIQRGATAPAAPHPTAMVMSLIILRRGVEAGVLPQTSYSDVHRLELALRLVLA